MSHKSKHKLYATLVEDKNHNHQTSAWASAANSLPYTKIYSSSSIYPTKLAEVNRELGASSSGNTT